MDPFLITSLLTEISRDIGRPEPTRESLRVWSMSGVERLTYPDGTTAIFKYATEPFIREDKHLRAAARAGIPVPHVLGSTVRNGLLAMVLEDLGEPVREAQDTEAVAAAVALHQVSAPLALAALDQKTLAALPGRAMEHLRQLQAGGRWTEGTDEITTNLTALIQAAESRTEGAEMAPFGWVHSEFHSTSLHIGRSGWRLLDFAHTFAGPGLLDLAAWQGLAKAQPPDPERLRTFIEAYVAAGGHHDALRRRGGLTAENWALGWHRVWAVEWFFEQARIWINQPAQDPGSIKVVRRHLASAARLLGA